MTVVKLSTVRLDFYRYDKKMRAYEVSKEILFMSDYLTLLYSGPNEFRGHTSFLEWAHAFIVPIVHSLRHLRDLP